MFVGLLVVVVALVGAGLVYKKPLWVADQTTHYRIWRMGGNRHFVQLPEGRIRYYDGPTNEEHGGVPLVLIHGLDGRSEDFEPLLGRFEENGFHYYALDLLGYGESDKPAWSDYSIATEERVVLHFMDAMHLKQAYVVGWSMGGWVALKLALDAPDRVERMAVYDSAGLNFETDADISLMAPTDHAGVERLIRRMSPTMKFPPPFVEQQVIGYLGRQRWVVERSLRAMRTGNDMVDTRLASMRPPLLIVHGSEDALIPPSVAETMHRLDPRSVYVSVEGCGHFAPAECADAVGKATVAFFRSQPVMVGEELTMSH